MTNKQEQNAEVFSRVAHDLGDPVLKAYAQERTAAIVGNRPFNWERYGYEIGMRGGTRPPCATVDSSWAAGHGRSVTAMPTPPCPVQPPRCDCHVIGTNTLGGNQLGIASIAARTGVLTADSGDASYFVPYYIFLMAFAVGADPDNTTAGAGLPLLLLDSRSGREPNLRRASRTDPSFGILTTVYADQKEIECVDWLKFASVNNQELRLDVYNVNDVEVHAFADIWGIPAA